MPRPDFLADIAPVGDPYVLGRWHKDRVSHLGYLRELKAFAKARLRPRPAAGKALIIGRARSGTTLLVHLLGQVPAIRCEGEVLHYAVARPRAYLNDLARAADAQVYACKLLSYQLLEVHPQLDPHRFLGALAADGWSMVHIRRATFDQAMSLSVAQMTGQYTRLGKQAVRPTRVEIDVDLFMRQVRWNEALLGFETALMRELPHVSIDYDADLAPAGRQQGTIDRLCAALGVPAATVAAPTKRILGGDYARSIANFDAVLAALAAEGLGHLAPA